MISQDETLGVMYKERIPVHTSINFKGATKGLRVYFNEDFL